LHKWNLKDPQDTNAAFRLVFNGGWTHSSTGATPNGTNGYADTFLNTDDVTTTGLWAFGAYVRTLPTFSINTQEYITGLRSGIYHINFLSTAPTTIRLRSGSIQDNTSIIGADGFIAQSRSSTTSWYGTRNSTNTTLSSSLSTLGVETVNNFVLSAFNNLGVISQYSTQQLAFAFYAEPLLTTEMSNFYTAVQAFNTTLGRSVGPQTVSEPDAQAFVTAADIQDQVQAQAINNLTISLKNYGIWGKMKAIYPFVGGTASSHKWNLKDSRDLDAAFRLNFLGGWTHDANGVQPNGTNGYADTFFNLAINASAYNSSFGVYNRSNNIVDGASFGVRDSGFKGSQLFIKATDNNLYFSHYDGFTTFSNINSLLGLYQMTLNPSNTNNKEVYRNSTLLNSSLRDDNIIINDNVFFAARNIFGTAQTYDNKQSAFFYIGENLTSIEIGNLYTAVQSFNTALARNI